MQFHRWRYWIMPEILVNFGSTPLIVVTDSNQGKGQGSNKNKQSRLTFRHLLASKFEES